MQSRDNFRVAENPAEKQFWAYQTKGFADEISRRLDQYPISRYVLNTIHGCQGCYKKLLQFAKKIPENTQNIDDPMKNSNYRVGRVIAKKRKEAIQKKSLVRGIFDERVGLLRPEYAVIAAACDRAFDYFPNEVEEALIWELRRKHLQECPLDSPIRADSKLTFNDILTESEELVEELENQKQISEELQLIDNPAKFTERQRQVYRLRREGATFKEIGEKLGIRRQGAQKTEKATRKKLDSYLKS